MFEIYIIIIFSGFISACGTFLFKLGFNDVGQHDLKTIKDFFSFFLRLVKTPKWILGLILYASSWAVNMYGFQNADLSFVKPLYTVNVVFLLILSRYFLHEKFGKGILIPAGIIILAIFLLGLTPSKTGGYDFKTQDIVFFFSVLFAIVVVLYLASRY